VNKARWNKTEEERGGVQKNAKRKKMGGEWGGRTEVGINNSAMD